VNLFTIRKNLLRRAAA